MQQGVTIIMVPLLGLGTDQVIKSMREEKSIKAWHVDKLHGTDTGQLREYLLKITLYQQDNMSAVIFMLSLLLLPDSE